MLKKKKSNENEPNNKGDGVQEGNGDADGDKKKNNKDDTEKPVTLTLTIDAVYSKIIADDESKKKFEEAFAEDISSKLGILSERIRVTSVKAGSIIVTFDILPDKNGSTGGISANTLATKLEEKVNKGSFKVTFNGQELAGKGIIEVIATTIKPTTEMERTSPTANTNIGLIIGCALAGVVGFIAIMVVINVLLKKTIKKKNKVDPAREEGRRQPTKEKEASSQPKKGEMSNPAFEPKL